MLGTSSVIDDAADACEEMVDEIIKMAGVRMQALLLLMHEIATLIWRVNALEKMLLPELRTRERTTESMRDEREEFKWLFLIKKKKNRMDLSANLPVPANTSRFRINFRINCEENILRDSDGLSELRVA